MKNLAPVIRAIWAKAADLTRPVGCLFALLAPGIVEVKAQNVDAVWGSNNNAAWYTPGNWSGGKYAGSQGTAASNSNVATFTSAATASTFQINFSTANLNLGAISLDASRASATNIGDNVATAGVLRLYGTTVNSASNVIIRNNGAGLLTLQAAQNGTMGVVLATSTNNINIDSTGGVTISSVLSEGVTGANLTLGGAGAGVLTLSGLNTYTGATTISQGTLSASIISSGSSNLGNATSAVVLGGANTAGTLSYTGNATTYTRGFTVNAGGGGFTNAGTALLTVDTGGITDGGAFTLAATSSGGITVNSVISSTGSLKVNSSNTGVVTLAGANNYSGGTTLTLGSLTLSGSGTLGSISNSLAVNGGTLNLNGTSQTVGALTGSGGTIIGNSGTSTLTIGSGNATGAYSGNITSGAGTLAITKIGTGNETLSGTNSYSGVTTVSQGTLTAASASAIGSANYVYVLTGGTLALSGGITLSGTGNIYLAGTGVSGQATIYNANGNNGTARTINLDGASGNPSVGSAFGTLSLTGTVMDFSGTPQLQITGAGTVALSGANTYAGGTNVTGALALGASDTITTGVVASGPVGKGTLTLGEGSTLRSSNTGARTIENNLSLNGGVTLGDATNTGSLTFDSTGLTTAATVALTANTSANVLSAVTFANAVNGNSTFTKSGAGTLNFTGGVANTYSGLTTVSQGTLSLGKSTVGIAAIAGNLAINGGAVSYGSAVNEQIADTSNVALSSGTFDLGARTETVYSLSMSGGTLNKGGNILTLDSASSFTGGTVTFSAQSSQISVNGALALGGTTFNYSTTGASSDGVVLGGNVTYADTSTAAATFNNTNATPGVGKLDLGGATRTFDIAASTTINGSAPEVQIGWNVQNGGILKTGTGTLLLSAANSYAGKTIAGGGVLEIANNGGTTAGRITGSAASDSVQVNTGGTLLLSGAGNQDRINTAAGVTLAGGTLTKGTGASEGSGATTTDGGASHTNGTAAGFGILTLTANSTLDFGTGAVGTFTFADLVRTTGAVLNILNYSTTASGYDLTTSGTDGTDDRLIFKTDQSSFLSSFRFNGVGASQIVLGDGFEIVPVPEPATILAGVLAVGALGWNQRRRIGNLRGLSLLPGLGLAS